MDWGGSALLALLTLLEGLRRVQPGSIILRKLPGSPWQASTAGADTPRFQLVSWWPPFTISLLLPPPATVPAATVSHSDPAARIRPARVWIAAAGALGGITLVGLVLALPAAIRLAGSRGFILGLAALLLASLATSAITLRGGVVLGLPWKQAARRSAKFLSPFAAPGAAEYLFRLALEDLPRLALAQFLLPPGKHRQWLRSRAFDALSRSTDPELEAAMGRPALDELIRRPPEGAEADSLFCPRCGDAYVPERSVCTRCDVALAAVTGPSPGDRNGSDPSRVSP